MSLSLHHSKKGSELPDISNKISLSGISQNNKYRVMQNIGRKNPLKNGFSEQAQLKLSLSMNNILNQNNEMIKNIKNQESLKRCLNIPEKYLAKNKKYYRVDAQMKTKQNIMKNDIQNIIENLVHQKERNDLIVLNLRKDFAWKRQSSLLKLNKQNFQLVDKKNTNKKQNHILRCPISSVNQFSEQKDKCNTLSLVLNQNKNNFFGKISSLNTQMKNFKRSLQFYIKNVVPHHVKKHSKAKRRIINKKSKIIIFSNNLQNQVNKAMIFLSINQRPIIQLKLCKNQASKRTFQQAIMVKIKFNRFLKVQTRKLCYQWLRSFHKSLQPSFNSPQIINRIILTLNLNPLNDFQFIKQETFTKLRKLMTGQNSRKQARDFLLKYFFLDNSQVNMDQFFSCLNNILRKLKNIINDSTIESIFQHFSGIIKQCFRQFQSRQQVSNDLNKSNICIKKVEQGQNKTFYLRINSNGCCKMTLCLSGTKFCSQFSLPDDLHFV